MLPLCVIGALDSKREVNTASIYVIHGLCRRCNFSWESPLNKIVLVLTFISPGATVIDATVIFLVFFVVLDKNSDLSCCRDLSRSEGKLNICKPSKERIRTCNDYVIEREITTLLNIAVENVILM